LLQNSTHDNELNTPFRGPGGLGSRAYAEIIIPLALPKNYTWSVPASMMETLQPGCRVEVNLGKNKRYAGIVKRIHEEKPALFEPKDILNVLDAEPIVFPEQLQLWEWMASYYMCTEGEVMAAALPAHFKLSSETIIVFNDEYGDDFSALDHDEFLVAEALLIKKELKLPEVQQILDSSHVYPVINSLISKKVCIVWEALKQTYSARKESFVQLDPAYKNEEKLADLMNNWSRARPNGSSGRAPKQLELLLAWLHLSKKDRDVTKTELLKKSGASDAQLKGLVDKGILRVEKRNVDRLPVLPKNVQIDFQLTPNQQKAYDEVRASLDTKAVCLIHGITSSGKTMIYIKLIADMINSGKQVLYVLPEIALTSQIIRRLQKHFGGHIGIYHSKFSHNERVELWNKLKNGELSIVLGARSAVFLPFRDLGLIICDEEHDTSYKQQDPAPRYNGRDAGIFLASLFNAKVVLGSGTPSIESYFNAQSGKYGFVELMQRYGDLKLPPIEIIDTRKLEKTEKNKIILSPQLTAAIQEVLDRGKQVILFQNRRGYSPYQVCTVCGWIPQCKYCDVSLTFHKLSNKLVCHYCGTRYPPMNTCAVCGSDKFAQRNFGTEKIEEMLPELFAGARIARMDMDTVRGKNAHDTLIRDFEQKKIDILVGTQMVVKGLDFENVDLVGILDADGLLHFADFRVNERAFQLMEQVSGRAGRKEETGKVLIQASQVNHPVLQFMRQHDYKKMYEEEIEKRKQFFYPPFSRIIHLAFRHKMKDIVERAAYEYAKAIKNKYEKYMVGPAEPVINRIRNQYIMEMLIKLPRDTKLIAQCKHDLLEQVAMLHQERSFRSVTVIPDVDAI